VANALVFDVLEGGGAFAAERGFCCVNFRQARSDNLRAESGRQRIELLRGGQLLSAGCEHLAFLEHVHELDACQRAPSRPEGDRSKPGGHGVSGGKSYWSSLAACDTDPGLTRASNSPLSTAALACRSSPRPGVAPRF